MLAPHETAIREEYRHRVLAAPLRVLMLDYDGTLAPFVQDRNAALPYLGVPPLLDRIRADERNRLILVSGRAIDDLVPLLGMDPPPEIWGSHGYEHLSANGEQVILPIPEESEAALQDAWYRTAATERAERLERKPVSIAVHWRGEDPADTERIERHTREAWQHGLDSGLLELHAFDGGLELRIPGRTKGDAVRDIMQQYGTAPHGTAPHGTAPHGTGPLYAYFGDDHTDEDAFEVLDEVLGNKGLSVLVRAEARETKAAVRITPPDELLEWLTLWTQPRPRD